VTRTTVVPAARTALEAAGLPETTVSPAGQPATAGYLVIALRALGPNRAAVRWYPPGGQPTAATSSPRRVPR
jgi:hypothetical protein